MGFFKNLIKSREEWLKKPYFRNTHQDPKTKPDPKTNTKTK